MFFFNLKVNLTSILFQLRLRIIKLLLNFVIYPINNSIFIVKKYFIQQIIMLGFWWRKPSGFDITPLTPPRRLFGNQIKIGNGAFRPTLADIISGRAKKKFFR